MMTIACRSKFESVRLIGFVGLLHVCSGFSFVYAADKQVQFKNYTNVKYGYSIAYPVGILIPQGESDASDGQKFVSDDGQSEMTVWASYNIDHRSIKDLLEEGIQSNTAQSANVKITYKTQRGNWFVISGLDEGRIFYQKTFLKKDTVYTFLINYPESQKLAFDGIVKEVGRSFHDVETNYARP